VLIPASVQIHLAVEPVDLRNSIDGLAAMVEKRLGEDPLCGHVFVFHNRTRTGLKFLVWDHGGFVLVYKRLERGRYRIPQAKGGRVRMTPAELGALMEGIDLTRARRLPRWNPARND
jgi:transposase